MAFVAFNDLGYEYLDQGYFVLFSENNTHNRLFEYAAKDLTSLPKLFSEYVDTRLDANLTPIRDQQSNEVIGQIMEVLKSAHEYYKYEDRRAIINEIGNYFNELLIFLCYKCRTISPDLPKSEEWYLERIKWLMYPLLSAGDTYPTDFYGKYKDWISADFYTSAGSEEDYETIVCDVPKKRPSGFREEIRIQKVICDMLYFILDMEAQDMGNLTLPQRMWLFANLFPDSYSEIEITRKLSFCPKPRFRSGTDRTQEIERNQRLKDIFAPLHSLDSRTIAKMQKNTKDCFKSAIKAAEDIETAPIYEEYEIDSLKQLLYLEIISMIQAGTIIRKCKNCSRYFVVNNRKVTYCDRVDKTGKRCSAVGSQRSFQKKMAEEEELKIYTRAYKTHFARVKKGTMGQDAFAEWCTKAKVKLEQVRAGKLDIAAFQEWLKK